MSVWQSVETAPKDGTRVICWEPGARNPYIASLKQINGGQMMKGTTILGTAVHQPVNQHIGCPSQTLPKANDPR
jgi:hypothetical protein